MEKPSTMLIWWKRFSIRLRYGTIIVIVLLALRAMEVNPARTVKDRDLMNLVKQMRMLRSEEMQDRELENLFESQLPRGLVPPSGPSPCHNDEFFNFTNDDYVSCP